MRAERVRAIFDREILAMEANMEPSTKIEWLERLRDEVLAEHIDGEKRPKAPEIPTVKRGY